MELTEIDLKELKIKTGPRKRILNLIKACNNVVKAKIIYLTLVQVINQTYEWNLSQEIVLDEVLVQSNTQIQVHSNENVQNKENTNLPTTENTNSNSSKSQKVLVSFENNSKEVKNLY